MFAGLWTLVKFTDNDPLYHVTASLALQESGLSYSGQKIFSFTNGVQVRTMRKISGWSKGGLLRSVSIKYENLISQIRTVDCGQHFKIWLHVGGNVSSIASIKFSLSFSPKIRFEVMDLLSEFPQMTCYDCSRIRLVYCVLWLRSQYQDWDCCVHQSQVYWVTPLSLTSSHQGGAVLHRHNTARWVWNTIF